MRALQTVVVLCLAFAGLSFSKVVKYYVQYSEFKPSLTLFRRLEDRSYYYQLPSTDTLKLIINAIGAGQIQDESYRMYGAPLYVNNNPNSSKYVSGLNQGAARAAVDLIRNGCSVPGLYLDQVLSTVDTNTYAIWVAPRNASKPQLVNAGIVTLKENGKDTFVPYATEQTDYHYYRAFQRNTCSDLNPSTNILGAPFAVYRVNGDAGSNSCTTPSVDECMQCAYPYVSKPDTLGCGCKVDAKKLLPKNTLAGMCNIYCNTTPINGNQSYIDYTRSNFDANSGTIQCACSDRQTVVYKPTGTCPKGSNPSNVQTQDTTYQTPIYDPTTKPTTTGGVSGGTGQFDSSSNQHLSRIDSILGLMNDTTGVKGMIDSLEGKGKYDSAIGHDTSAIRSQIGDLQGDTSKSNTQNWFGGSEKRWRGVDCWTCDTVPDTSIVLDLHTFGVEIKDTITIGLAPVMTGLGIDFWPILRYLEWLAIVIGMTPICINIAGGTTGKDSV